VRDRNHWMRRRPTRRVLLCVTGMMLALACPTVIWASMPSGAAVTSDPASTPGCQTEGSAFQLFAMNVAGLGRGTYGDTYAGAIISGCQLTIYVAPASDTPAFENALSALDSTGAYAYTLVPVSLSWDRLENITTALPFNVLQQEGVIPTQWGPNPSGNDITMTLEPPTIQQLGQLDAAMAAAGLSGSASTANYKSLAQQLIQATYNDNVVVTGSGSPPSPDSCTALDRQHDCSPFSGGDKMISEDGTEGCTGGFAVTGNSSGNAYLLTDGHCGNHVWDVDPTGVEIGRTGTVHWDDAGNDDVEGIETVPNGPYSAQAVVWGNNGNNYDVTGQKTVVTGSLMTVDGSYTGEVTDNTVQQVDICATVDNNGNLVKVCHLDEVSNSSPPCQHGDSGGPAYVHIGGTGNVDAVGL
jgi:hypothetical protein